MLTRMEFSILHLQNVNNKIHYLEDWNLMCLRVFHESDAGRLFLVTWRTVHGAISSCSCCWQLDAYRNEEKVRKILIPNFLHSFDSFIYYTKSSIISLYRNERSEIISKLMHTVHCQFLGPFRSSKHRRLFEFTLMGDAQSQ